MRPINLIVLHCSGSDLAEHDDIRVIREWHLKRGFSDVGYGFFIQFHGGIQLGRPLREIPAHVKGKNAHSIGICLSGLNDINDRQLFVARQLISELQDIFNIENDQILGHYELDEMKTCPNIDMELFRSKLRWSRKESKNYKNF